MENTATRFTCEVENLSYYIVEQKIADYFDMGYPSSSSFPQELEETTCHSYSLSGTKKTGTFLISANKLNSGKYELSVSLNGKLHKK